MIHLRERYALRSMLAKLKFARVVGIQGARQTGKSTLARDILAARLSDSSYFTFDQTSMRRLAEQQPDSFLAAQEKAVPLILDEAQKVPAIFDAVKLRVDLNPKPGQVVLLGSTEFSRELKIRESLTGRLSRLRIYPLTLPESLGLAFSYRAGFNNAKTRVRRSAFFRYLDRGGFPGIFAVRSQKERESLFQDWLALVTTRDLIQFQGFRTDSALAQAILETIPGLETPDLTSIARKTRYNPRAVKTHLHLLAQLFAVHAVPRHPLGSGKTLYYLCDVGLASFLNADLKRKLETWLVSELLAQNSYAGTTRHRISYYRSSRGKRIDLIAEYDKETVAIKLSDTEKVDLREFEILEAFRRKSLAADRKRKVRLVVLGPYLQSAKIGGIELQPWEVLA